MALHHHQHPRPADPLRDTRARPLTTLTRSAACRAIVELQVPATTLRDLATDPTTPADWADVIADLTHQLDHHTASGNQLTTDADRRVPGAALRRYLEIRDRYCIMIDCRAPAHTADKDHTIDYTHGGPTLAPNLGDACRTIIDSRARAAGYCTNSDLACSAGPADLATPTTYTHPRSSSHYPTPIPATGLHTRS